MVTTSSSGFATRLRAIADKVPADAPWAVYQPAARQLDSLGSGGVPSGVRVRAALLASFTIEPFVPVLRVEAARIGVWLDIHVAPYAQYFQELLDPRSHLYRFRPHVTFIAIDSEVLWDLRWAGGEPRDSDAAVAALVEPLCAGIAGFGSAGTGAVVVNDFVLPRASTEGVNAFRRRDTFAHTVGLANKRLRKELSRNGTTFLFPFADLVTSIGRRSALNWRMHYRGHLTWSDALSRLVARRWAGYAAAAIGRATKCLVLDLDDTLWGGVLGEAGFDGIAIGPEGRGRAFLDFQRELLDLQRQGILLAVASKNNPDEALAVLRRHPHQLIREEHLAAIEVGWTDKATSIRSIAAGLGIALDHMLFVDDSPHERAWVRSALPELLVPDPPADPADLADWLGTLSSLVLLQQTEEDTRRTRRYREERRRAELRDQAGDLDQFLRRLGIRVRIEQMTRDTQSRVAQLIARTNQFNFTTRRHDEVTLARAAAAGDWLIYTMSVADQFGESGLVGVAIVEPHRDSRHIESFLLSCRVIGKSVESALLAAIAEDARAAGAKLLTAEFIDSGRNAPASEVLAAHGFMRADHPNRWSIRLRNGALPWPDHIQRVVTGETATAATAAGAR